MPQHHSIPSLSVVIPCYNEEATLAECLKQVLAIASDTLKLQIIIVDDASHDNSVAIACAFAAEHTCIQVVRHGANGGKGTALRTGFAIASGDYVVVQDADLEYNPQELLFLLAPLIRNDADIVFGSRFRGNSACHMPYGGHRLANQALTFVSNLFTGLSLSDMETCYKMFRRDIIQSISIEEKRFGVEPEMVAKCAKLRLDGKRPRISEIGISYKGRTFLQGKKIGICDGFRALYCIAKYTLT